MTRHDPLKHNGAYQPTDRTLDGRPVFAWGGDTVVWDNVHGCWSTTRRRGGENQRIGFPTLDAFVRDVVGRHVAAALDRS